MKTVLLRLAARRGRRGVAAVEFALIAPLLIVMIGAAVDLGRGVERAIKLETAARAAAQYVVSNPLVLSGGAFTDVSQTTVNSAVGSSLAGVAGVQPIEAPASVCYCPDSTGSIAGATADTTCQAACANVRVRVRTLTARATFTPIFPTSGFIPFNALGSQQRSVTVRI